MAPSAVLVDGEGVVTIADGIVDNGYVPIAVCGMALRVPGGVHDPEGFWEFMMNKGEGRTLVPADRFNLSGFYSEKQPKQGTIGFQHGYYLEGQSLQQFDAGFFSMSRREVERMDPQQRLLLEVVHECMETAGETSWRGKNIGCMVGSYGQDWTELAQCDKATSGLYTITGQGDFLLSNRVSYEYDLKGPSFTVKTGCSSALVALHLACNSLARRDCEGVIVGGTNIITAPGGSISMTEQGVLSPEGRCKPFDANADGYARAEAINAIYIRRLDDALHDGTPIRGIIRGSSLNCDGKSASLASPSAEAHERLIRQAYSAAGIAPDAPFVECHGTGTKIGDPLETAAIASVFGNQGTYIGSVKANVGHSEGASGLTSLIKAVLALEQKIIPPNINFSAPNPRIPFQESNLMVPLEPVQWPFGRAQRASINSFGLGGANAHVVLESISSMGVQKTPRLLMPRKCLSANLVLLSANHAESLEAMVTNYTDYTKKNEDRIHDLAYTLAMRRDAMRQRTYLVVDNSMPEVQIIHPHTSAKATSTPRVSFVFTGQGAQWAEMGKSLIEDFPSFARSIDRMDTFLNRLPQPPKWSLTEELMAPSSKSHIDMPEFSQPLCAAIQIALVDLWRDFGIVPDSVIGHSSGEIAAAYAAGALTAEQAITVAYFRGQTANTNSYKREGAMVAVGLGANVVHPLLVDGAVIACENSSTSVTVSGDKVSVDAVVQTVKHQYPHVLVRQLRVQQAYHSHHMRDCGGVYHQQIVSLLGKVREPQIPFFSTVYGGVLAAKVKMNADYWRLNLQSPVLFDTAARSLLKAMENDNRIMLEIGPHNALAGPLRQILKDMNSSGVHYLSSIIRNRSSTVSLLDTVGQLWTRSAAINMSVCYPEGELLTDLPPYPWHHKETFWEENRVAKQWRFRSETPHEILGTRILEWNDIQPTWRGMLSIDEVPWIRHHKVGKDIVFPAAGYISMAGEAVRQLGGGPDFSLRDVVVGNAMVITEDARIEVMTALRKSQLATTQTSEWYDFAISSFNGTSWIKHCWGQVLGGPAAAHGRPAASSVAQLPAIVDSDRWYRVMAKVGLNYTDIFHSLEQVRSHPIDHTATAKIRDKTDPQSEPRYRLHPSTIDNVFQLLTVAAAHGQPRQFGTLSVPTFIEFIYIGGQGRCTEVLAQTNAELTVRGGIIGSGVGFSNGELTFQLEGLKATPIDSGATPDPDPHAAVQLDWKPHPDFLDLSKCMRTTRDYRSDIAELEKLTVLCAVDTLERLANIEPVLPHFNNFYQWLQRFTQQLRNHGCSLFEGAQALVDLPPKEREEEIQTLYGELLQSEMSPYAIAVERNRLHAHNMFQGHVQPLDILMEDGNLHKLYDFLCFWDYSDLCKLLGHAKPTLRVLEIGAGTGGTTGTILNELCSEYGECLYSTYTYTDISPGFFTAAQQRFEQFQGMEYKVLDISKDPIAQGFDEASYDLILAANVLHATPNLAETLSNVRRLLHPGGRLLLQELNPSAKCVNFIFGVLPGWWLGAAEDRVDEPYISPERWHQELQAVGFSGADVVAYDNIEPFQINATIIASATKVPETYGEQNVTLIYHDEVSTLQNRYAEEFVLNGFRVTWRKFSEPVPEGESIVSLVELETPFLDTIEKQDFDQLIKWVAELDNRDVLWVTQNAQMGCADPRFAQILGLARNIRAEMSTAFATVELDDVSEHSEARHVLPQIFRKFQAREQTGALDPDFEYVISKGLPHVGRFHWISVNEELVRDSSKTVHEKNARLEIGTPGLLQTLRYVEEELPSLEEDEVLIKVGATGLNFKDVLIAMGVVDESGRGINASLGVEPAGTVAAVGSAVTSIRPGDRVMAVSAHCFALYTKCREEACVKIPGDLSFIDAATMPCVYGTAIRGLMDIGQMKKGQTVLIHSACGGVGIAAIQLCQMVGAKIFATVGSREKRRYLTEMFGIPPSDIFDSRSPSFVSGVMHATNGRGVDLCLNSLSGELLHYSWQCVAPFGTLLEIGKRDLVGRGRVSLHPFEDNRSYVGIDLGHIYVRQPRLFRSFMERTVQLLREGHIRPISPVTVFKATECEEMFRYVQKGAHMGKIVLEMASDINALPTIPVVREVSFKDECSYLITGGLGGLGRSTARWMVSRGAKHMVFISRRGRTPESEAFLAEIEAAGCNPVLITGSVEDEATVKHAISRAKRPIAGVVHGAMVLKDHATRDMPYDKWQAVMGPRVSGAWNLHNNLLGHELDFFILLSSFSGMVGQWGQANYAASNTFLDAFVQYRQGLGLPASALDMGPIDDVGYVAESPAVLENMLSMNVYAMDEQAYLDSLQMAVVRSKTGPSRSESAAGYRAFTNPATIGVGMRSTKPLDDPTNRLIWRRDIRLSIYRNLEKRASSGDSSAQKDELKQILASDLSDPSTVRALALEIGKTLFGFLMRPEEEIILNLPLGEMGVDSLVSIELRNWCRQHLSLEVSVLEIMQATLEQLASSAVESLCTKRTGSTRTGQGQTSTLPEEREKYNHILQVKAP